MSRYINGRWHFVHAVHARRFPLCLYNELQLKRGNIHNRLQTLQVANASFSFPELSFIMSMSDHRKYNASGMKRCHLAFMLGFGFALGCTVWWIQRNKLYFDGLSSVFVFWGKFSINTIRLRHCRNLITVFQFFC